MYIYVYRCVCIWASLMDQTVMNLPTMQETSILSLGWEDPLEDGMTSYLSSFAWRIPWTDEPGGLVYGVAKNWT